MHGHFKFLGTYLFFCTRHDAHSGRFECPLIGERLTAHRMHASHHKSAEKLKVRSVYVPSHLPRAFGFLWDLSRRNPYSTPNQGPTKVPSEGKFGVSALCGPFLILILCVLCPNTSFCTGKYDATVQTGYSEDPHLKNPKPCRLKRHWNLFVVPRAMSLLDDQYFRLVRKTAVRDVAFAILTCTWV